ncbi:MULTISPECIES: thioesterase family protein [unclassified Fusibacter]|uniref:acyl-CoA thioesterase n=1 Tax=unclassified Fusibacter TaxID=2624464 RepID=UPI0010139AF0|nr:MULTISPECIES: acyl-CoA thioesterase [unclassified Fusibacter]MCK8060214.1 acyl-CoA thioesterase [Fusibacter sp. A2]NPE22354.1 acyl-CoA thioesterase [Fusibacter sp. A1]RXV61126.1 acyl-CoA thioesterase [Fusibacter sp. A1]
METVVGTNPSKTHVLTGGVSLLYFPVRYAETDKMGIVHHSNYPVWFEAGRTQFFMDIGVPYHEIEAKGVWLPLYDMNCQFITPAEYGKTICVKTSIAFLSRLKLHFKYVVESVETGAVVAKGETMHAFTNTLLKPINADKKLDGAFVHIQMATVESLT